LVKIKAINPFYVNHGDRLGMTKEEERINLEIRKSGKTPRLIPRRERENFSALFLIS